MRGSLLSPAGPARNNLLLVASFNNQSFSSYSIQNKILPDCGWQLA
jgi:hypothetical protein